MAIHVDPAVLVTADVSWQAARLPELHNAGELESAEAVRQAVAQIHGGSPGGNDIEPFLKRQTPETRRSIAISCRALRNRELTLSDVLELVEQCAISYCA